MYHHYGKRFLFCVPLLLVVQGAPRAEQPPYLHAPSVQSYATFNPQGTTILCNGRLLHPFGHSIPVDQWPHGLVVSPDNSTAFIASGSTGQFVYNWQSKQPTVKRVIPTRPGVAGSAVFSPDGKTLYWAGGDNGGILVYDVATRTEKAFFSINGSVQGKTYQNSVTHNVRLSPDGSMLYCTDIANFRVVSLNAATGALQGSVHTGYYPYALALAGSHLYVANIGMFRYHLVPPAPKGYPQRGITRPPYGVPSEQARTGVDFEGRRIPGLNDPNAAPTYSVWGIDIRSPQNMQVVQQIKTGVPVGAATAQGPAIGGSAPNYLLVQNNTLFVSDNNDDLIEQYSTVSGRLLHRTQLQPSPLVKHLRGVEPAGMTLSPGGKRLYIAEIGINAIGVMSTRTGKMLGNIPTAWYPYRVCINPSGSRLGVICFRGFGNGPNAGSNIPVSPFLGMKGVFTTLPVPASLQLRKLTRRVLAYNGIVNRSADRADMTSPVIPDIAGKTSPCIKYVVFILKENHTYDTIFDRIPGARSDSSLLRWGLHQTISAPGEPTLHNVAVMTNHNALARQFTVSDNFYMEPEMSGVGHRWLVDVKPNDWCQMLYTLGWQWKPVNSSPGRLVPFGANAGAAPEDFPENGTMWNHLAHNHISFRNYGEGFEFAGVEEDDKESPTGARETVNIPMTEPLYQNTCFTFPLFNMNIPDQYRAKWFEQDITRNYLSKGKPMPHFLCVDLCNDHGTRPNPKRGYPYVASWMADDDLALGRIVQFLSHTPEWKQMAIFVTEDDSGGEPDHVDAQRSVMLVISPWAKRGYVSHVHTTIVSMHRTLYEIFGLPPLSMTDALCNDFSDCFTTTPDFAPYTHTAVDPRIFNPENALLPGEPDYKMNQANVQMDNPAVVAWVAAHPGSRPVKR